MERTKTGAVLSGESLEKIKKSFKGLLIWSLVGFATAFLKLGGVISPFPPALIFILPLGFGLTAAIGASVAGGIIAFGGGSPVMLLTILLCFAARLIGERYRKFLPALLATAAIVSLCLTNKETSGFIVWISALYYSVLCLGAYGLLKPLAGFADISFSALSEPRVLFSALVVLFAVFTTISYSVGGLVVSDVAAMLVLLIIMKDAKSWFAGACGAACGLLMAVGNGGQVILSPALALGCFAMAEIKKSGIFKQICFLTGFSVVIFSFSPGLSALICFYEALVAVMLSICIPLEASKKIQTFLYRNPESDLQQTTSGTIELFHLCETIEELRRDFNEVCRRLDTMKNTNPSPDKIAEKVCGVCRHKNLCYNIHYQQTTQWLAHLETAAKSLSEPPAPPVASCSHINELYTLLAKNHKTDSALSSKLLARQAVMEQFSILSDMLLASVQLPGGLYSDGRLGQKIMDVCKHTGLPYSTVHPRVYDNGMVEVILTAKKPPTHLQAARLQDAVCEYCGFSTCQITSRQQTTGFIIQLKSTPKIKVDFAVAQIPANAGDCCGDCFVQEMSGSGQKIFVLCDGMGTGGDAAVDGTMAASFFSRLCGCDVSPDIAIRLANTALMVRADTESLATVDALIIDPCHAKARMFKAGAFTSFILRHGTVLRFDGGALPIGIIGRPDYHERDISLHSGDMILMASDGAVDADWLAEALQNIGDKEPDEFCNVIAAQAKARQEKADDVTVALVCVE